MGWGGHSFKWKQILSLWLPLFTLEQNNYRDPRSIFAQGWAGKFRGAQICLYPPFLLLKASRPLNELIKCAKDSQNHQIFASTLSSFCRIRWKSSNCETHFSSLEKYWLRNVIQSGRTSSTCRWSRATNSRAFKNTLHSRMRCRMFSSAAFSSMGASCCRWHGFVTLWPRGQTLKGHFNI